MNARLHFAGRSGLLAAALLVAACTDTSGPERGGLAPPTLATGGGGVTLDQKNGSLGGGAPTQLLGKGFNPTNPHHGDAIVVTFFWLGSSNVITRVHDQLTNGTPVGNPYALVEYVTAGGISMATYVATNVQNFPDPNVDQNDILVVLADLSTQVPDGGTEITAFSGVEAVTAQALGEHRSASGTGSAVTTANPGAINANAGALVYGVSMVDVLVGFDPPAPPFANILTMGANSGTMKSDGEYAVPTTAGAISPQWGWHFEQATNPPRTWLASVIALNAGAGGANQPPTAAFTSSCTGLTCTFTSTSSDPDGSIAAYSWNFGDGATSTVQNPSHTFAAGGTFTVTLTVTDNQGATGSTSHAVTVTQTNQPPVAAFTSSCTALSCTFTSTSSDPDGSITAYAWAFGDGATATAQNPSHTYAAGGTYTVTLTVTDNQGATGSTSHTVTVTQANQSPVAAFTSSCNGLTCTFTSTSSDPDGSITAYSWAFGDGGTSTAQNPSHTYGAGGSYTVTLTVTDNQAATGSTSHTVTVNAPNQPPVANFTNSCNGLTCSFTSTSSDPDGSITAYSWAFGDGGTSTAQNPSHTYGAGGSYTVTLTVTDNQGATGSTSHTVTVNAPNQPPVANFTYSCNGLTCSFTSTSSDPDGSITAYSWAFGDGGTSTAQNPSHTYGAGGSYTVTLTVTDNQGATGSTSHTVTVNAPNQPPVASFTNSCNGLTCSFTSTSSDPDGSIAAYSWAFGDGGTSTAQNPSHTYGAGGSYTVTLTVTDNQGATGSKSRTITVTAPNQPPVASFTNSCNGLTCGFTSTSSDPDGSITAYSWAFGDGGTSTAQNPSHTYGAGGSYTVTLTVTDNQGASRSTSKTVTVTQPNSPPIVNAGPDDHTVTGLLYSTSVSFSDPNNNGPWSYTIDWGDGSTSTGTKTSQGTFSAGHTYVTILPKSFTIRVTITDAAGASGSDSKVVSVLLL